MGDVGKGVLSSRSGPMGGTSNGGPSDVNQEMLDNASGRGEGDGPVGTLGCELLRPLSRLRLRLGLGLVWFACGGVVEDWRRHSTRCRPDATRKGGLSSSMDDLLGRRVEVTHHSNLSSLRWVLWW